MARGLATTLSFLAPVIRGEWRLAHEIEFWKKEALKTKKRELAAFALGVSRGLTMAVDEHGEEIAARNRGAMKRYLLFTGSQSPNGGWSDLYSDFDSLDEIAKVVRNLRPEWYEIVDTKIMKMVGRHVSHDIVENH